MSTLSSGGVRVRNLTWTPFASPEPLLRNISVAIKPAERVLLVGPSGSGKSTLLRAIAGVLTETESGEMSGQIDADPAGLLLQDPNDSLVSDSIYREIAFGLENTAIEPNLMPALVEAGLQSVDLRKSLDHPSEALSGGEMQRMAFAGVVAMMPAVLLLDEPTSMLDAQSAAAVRAAVQAHIQTTKSTLIVVEHEFTDWLPLVDRILVLNHGGEIILDGEPNDILSRHKDDLQGLGLWSPNLSEPKPTSIDLSSSPGGRITALTGPSGAGKTTELKRRMRAKAGQVATSRTATKASAKSTPKTATRSVGYLPQQAELTFFGDSIIEPAETASQLGVEGLTGRNPYEVSGGEQRRLALAAALEDNPKWVYLDEPTVGQDREAWSKIVGVILAARNAGVDLTIATHDRRLIKLADQVVDVDEVVGVVDAFEVAPAGSGSTAVVVESSPQVSALAILIAPLLLLIGSMRVTSISTGLAIVSGLAFAFALLWVAGFRLRSMRALMPGLIAILSIGFSNWYLSANQQPETGLIAALRVACFVLPGIVLAAQLRPIAMGDQLGQWLRIPARPVISAVAAMQRLKVLIATWDDLRFIHSLRGAGVGRNPIARARALSSLVFGLLVQAIRSAGNTAVAMDARGFSRPSMRNRTWATKAHWGRLDWLVLTLAIVVAIVPLMVAAR